MTISTKIATPRSPPNLETQIPLYYEFRSNKILIWICTARYRGVRVSRFGGFRRCSIFSRHGGNHVRQNLFTCVTWLIRVARAMTSLCVWHDLGMCHMPQSCVAWLCDTNVTWRSHLCEINVTWRSHLCDLNVTWRSFLCDTNVTWRSHLWAIAVTWRSHLCDINMTWRSFLCDTNVTWRSHLCDMPRLIVWHDVSMCVTLFVHMCAMTQFADIVEYSTVLNWGMAHIWTNYVTHMNEYMGWLRSVGSIKL